MVPSRRSALIIAVDQYADAKLRGLRTPVRDAEELGRVLADEAIGGFDVETVLNEPEHKVRRKLAQFFANRSREDLLLVHFSCHGLKDDDGNLYFATPDTELEHVDSTAVPSEFVNRQMHRSRSRRKALFLDCCYSGAFSRGAHARASGGVEVGERFDGQGQVVITASNAMEYAFEGNELTGEGTPSVFTTALVEALESGSADRDGDDLVSIDELYDYVYERVRDTTPSQTPSKWTYDLRGDLYIARNPNPRPVSPTELPLDLRSALESPLTGVRLGVVGELERVLTGSNARLAAAARLALERLEGDDSRSVSEAAASALARCSVERDVRSPPVPEPAEAATPGESAPWGEEKAEFERQEAARREAEEQEAWEREKAEFERRRAERREAEERARREAEFERARAEAQRREAEEQARTGADRREAEERAREGADFNRRDANRRDAEEWTRKEAAGQGTEMAERGQAEANQRESDTPTPSDTGSRARFVRRFAAGWIDLFLLVLASAVASAVVGLPVSLTTLVLFLAYWPFCEGRSSSRTLGKRVLGLQVRDARNGGRIGYGRAVKRHALRVLSSLVVIGYLSMLWDDERETWYDKQTGSIVAVNWLSRSDANSTHV